MPEATTHDIDHPAATEARPAPLKAFRVIWNGTPKEPGIYIAATASKARAKAFRCGREVGYQVAFGDFKVTRAPEYDAWAQRQDERRQSHGLCEDVVAREVKS